MSQKIVAGILASLMFLSPVEVVFAQVDISVQENHSVQTQAQKSKPVESASFSTSPTIDTNPTSPLPPTTNTGADITQTPPTSSNVDTTNNNVEKNRNDREKVRGDDKSKNKILEEDEEGTEDAPIFKPVENPNTIKSLLPDIDTLTGALTYKYPISLPPGRNNLTPDLGLTYNSGVADNSSMAGYGWSLSLPYIERINRRGPNLFYSTSTTIKPTFASAISGELVLDSGTSTYRARVEDGSFFSYTFDGSKWLAVDKQGTKYMFGTTTASRLNNASSTDQVYKWMIEEVRDTNDNFIRFEYTKDSNQIYPSKIFYTGNGTTDGVFEVDFVYENKSDTVTSYAPAFGTITGKRLAKIQVKIGGVLTKDYILAYTTGHNLNRSLLSSVTASSTSGSLLPTQFSYQVASTTNTFVPSEIQLPAYHSTTTNNYHFIGLNVTQQFLDVNGDGLPDFVSSQNYDSATSSIANNDGEAPRVYLNTGNGWAFNTSVQLPTYYSTTTGTYHFMQLNATTQMHDVNGDGLPDFIYSQNYDSASSSIPNNNGDAPRIYLNTGSGWIFNPSFQLPSYYDTTHGTYHFMQLNSTTQLIDVNGDGLPDFVYSADYNDADGIISDNNNAAPRVYLNTGSGWNFDSTFQLPSYYSTVTNDFRFTGLNVTQQFLDVNGDNLPDFVSSQNYENATGLITSSIGEAPRVYMNTGHGWAFDSNSYQLPSYFNTTDSLFQFMQLNVTTQLIDVNSDGMPDFVYSQNYDNASSSINDNNNERPRVYMNTGHGWAFDRTTYQLPSWYDSGLGNYHFMQLNSTTQMSDVNGDGLPDFIYSADYGDADGVIDNNTNAAPRAYINTGNGWSFASSTYQLPSYYNAATSEYRFMGFNSTTIMLDVSGKGVPAFVASADFNDPDGHIDDNVNIAPRAYTNPGKASDYLAKIISPEGGTISLDYQLKAIGGPNPSREPFFPQSLYVVKDLVTNDGYGNFATTTYTYNNGEYHYNTDQFKQFAGFGRVDKTDAAGNITKTYFHQGNTSSTTIGEYDDNISKAGKTYRVEQYDGSGNLFTKTINKWDKYALNATSTFVKLASTSVMTYDGNGTHKDKAESSIYDNTNGNLTQKISLGEVTGSDDGTFTDTGTDKFTTDISYAASTTPHIIGLPSQQTVTDQSSNKVSEVKYYYDTLASGSVNKGNVTKQEMWKSGTSSPLYIDVEKTYNSYGLVTQEKDPRDKTTTYTYDTYNLYPATSTNALSQSTAYTYEYSIGKPNQVIDPNGFKYQATFDGFGRITSEKQPDISVPTTTVTKISYAYTDNTFPTSVHKIEYLDGTTEHDTYSYFDGLGRAIQDRSEAEDVNTFAVKDTVYNALGLVAKETLPYFGTNASSTAATSTTALYISHTYDPLKRVTAIANILGTTTNAYDDWKLTVTDALGKTKDLYKDAYDNLTRVDEHNSTSTYSTYYEYNGNKNLTKITDALGNIRNFTYDGLGRRLTAEDLHASGDSTFGTWSFVYDDAGNLATTTDPKSQTITHTYDDLNRPLTENYTGLAGTEITYGYDSCTGGIGKLCSATTTDAVSNYQYNALGLVSKETKTISSTNYTTDYTYNRLGKPTLLVYPDGSQVGYEYNNANLLEKVKQKEYLIKAFTDVVKSMSYSPLGQIATQVFKNNATSTYTYDASKLYRLTNKTTLGAAATKLQDISYLYDAVGNITKITDNSNTNSKKTVDYTYDDLHRLATASSTAVVSGTNYSETYSYNAIGNITNKSDVGAYSYLGSSGSNYANPHAVTLVAGSPFTYDNNGNLTGTGIATSTWNYNNQLTQVTSTASTTSYGYDHAGDRVKYTIGATTTISPNRLYDVTGLTKYQHIYADDQLVATIEKPSIVTITHFVHNDHLTGSNAISNSSATIDEVTDYMPYGKLRLDQSASSFKERKKFTGHEYDADTALSYMQARYQDGRVGRFVSEDPAFNAIGTPELKQKTGLEVEQYLSDPQQMNSYSYVGNNPLKYKDPSGEYIDTILDVGFISYDIFKIGQSIANGQNPQEHVRALGLDAVGAALPGVAGLGHVGAVAGFINKADNLGEIGEVADKVINITEKGLKHVIERHTIVGVKNAEKSIFNASENIVDLIQSAAGAEKVLQKQTGNFERVFDFGRNIGLDKVTGKQTQVMTVITDKVGNLVTAFPGRVVKKVK